MGPHNVPRWRVGYIDVRAAETQQLQENVDLSFTNSAEEGRGWLRERATAIDNLDLKDLSV